MPLKTTILVQTFAIKRKRLVPGAQEMALTEHGALKKTEAMAGRMPGTAALKIVADDETGELESATILGQFGRCRTTSPRACGDDGRSSGGRSMALRLRARPDFVLIRDREGDEPESLGRLHKQIRGIR